MITTVSADQTDILRGIMDLHNGGRPIQADFTFSTGAFWKHLPEPEIRCDIDDAHSNLTHVADIRHLPFKDGEIQSAVIDLPFIHAHGSASVMGIRFSSIHSQAELDDLHHAAAQEAARVIGKGGLLIWKCQDICESSKQIWNHIRVYHHCTIPGLFGAEDLFVLTRKNVMVGWNQHNQQHARKVHSYFWVFRRKS